MAITYTVYGKKTSDSGNAAKIAEGIIEKKYTVKNLDAGTEYQFQVATVDEDGKEYLSDIIKVKTLAASTTTTSTTVAPTTTVAPSTTTSTTKAPAIPDAPTISAVAKDGLAEYTITPPANDGGSAITGYNVYVKEASANWPDKPYATLTDLTGSVTGLTNGTEYTIAIEAANAAGHSDKQAALAHVTPVAVTTTSTTAKG
ncbi:fibronectin type III domain-containing protein [Sporolactobacillus shoreicorticis]|uniref:Fibronectin type III domain-containing protein n=1 Tax=Sporolactobacillus shoreicorticis TaxID=1923877 RepID=A0ABW5S7B3_9BACL|nr:fibronectin type III domain-containing protein [Sporolactobacillus shoreicorticis]MCO7126634.1 fibronectin type III domain-containing protein [Sporolactobacillus shoreicorticis]